jgi:hypothetical protein
MNGLDRDRTGGAVGGSRAGGAAWGPPSPVRRSKSGESGERVTEPPGREPPTATGPGRLARCPFVNRPG